MVKVLKPATSLWLHGSSPHFRNTRDGTTIKLDVNSGVCTIDMRVCLDEAGF